MLLLLTLTLVTLSIAPAPASASAAWARCRTSADAGDEGCTHPPAIVSLGDSYISGEAGRWAGNADTGNGGTVWGTDRAAFDCTGEDRCRHDSRRVYGSTSYDGGNRCDRSDVAPITSVDYPGVPRERRFNLACSGATTNEFTHEYAEKRERPQIEQLKDKAREYRVKMVVVSVGGNDLGFKDIVEDCARKYLTYRYCHDDYSDSDIDKRLDGVEENVTRTLKDIRQGLRDLGYEDKDYQLVVQSYPAPLPTGSDYRYGETWGRYTTGGCPFYDADTDWARNTLVAGLRAKLRRSASDAEADFLDVKDAFAGHELCGRHDRQATSANSSTNPLGSQDAEWVRWIPYLVFQTGSQGDQQEALHPNAFGQQALGTCLTELGGQLRTSSTRGNYRCDNDGKNGATGMTVTRTL
ncbi:GDSL-type esterase/lipase family protein [Streptomyces sp. NPDC002537]